VTAQAAAEAILASGTFDDYGGAYPAGDYDTDGNEGALMADSASMDLDVMQSWGHAAAVLSAASDFAGIGVACNPSGGAVVIELFADANAAAFNVGQSRVHAELAANSEYVSSGGTVTTVTSHPRMVVLPFLPKRCSPRTPLLPHRSSHRVLIGRAAAPTIRPAGHRSLRCPAR